MAIDLWRLDFSLMKWEEMNSLGDHVIFAGTNTGVCCSAGNLGLKSGCLYYTLPDDRSLYKFELNSTSNAILLPCLELQTTRFQSEWIMMIPRDSCKAQENMSGKDEVEEEKDVTLEAVENRTASESEEIQKNEEHNKEETSPWSILNEDMVVLIANCLHPFDYGRFRSVSKKYLHIMPKINLPEFYSTGSPYLAPWLVFSSDDTYSFINSENHHETYLMNFSDVLQGATIRCQKEGWLLMSRESKIFFYKPFTGEIIQLPDLTDLPELPETYHYSSISFDYPPTHHMVCMVFAVAQSSSDICFLVTGTGEDSWVGYSFPNANHDVFLPLCSAPIIYKDVLYCIDSNGALGTYDWRRDGDPWSVLTKPGKIFNDDMNPIFLVECGGNLLLVKLGHLGMPVRIFRLDLSQMEWVKVESLGRHMLFVNKTSCLSALAPNSRMENKIHFPRLCLNGEGILLYSLETNSYCSSGQNQHFPDNFSETEGWLSNCTWIQPNWTKSTAQELDWFRD